MNPSSTPKTEITHIIQWQIAAENAWLLTWPVALLPALGQGCQSLKNAPWPWLVQILPASHSVTLVIELKDISLFEAKKQIQPWLEQWLTKADITNTNHKVVEIPVYYGPEVAHDLDWVAKQCSLSPEQVINLHQQTYYQVSAIGFAPGFAYLSGLDSALHLPRRETPRIRVPKGAVAIAAGQSAVYPKASPGGWHIIGASPMSMFDPQQSPPSPLVAGDQVRFVAIDQQQYRQSGGDWEQKLR